MCIALVKSDKLSHEKVKEIIMSKCIHIRIVVANNEKITCKYISPVLKTARFLKFKLLTQVSFINKVTMLRISIALLCACFLTFLNALGNYTVS